MLLLGGPVDCNYRIVWGKDLAHVRLHYPAPWLDRQLSSSLNYITIWRSFANSRLDTSTDSPVLFHVHFYFCLAKPIWKNCLTDSEISNTESGFKLPLLLWIAGWFAHSLLLGRCKYLYGVYPIAVHHESWTVCC